MSNNLKTLINRDKYIERIAPYIKKPVIKVLIGQRRAGKSFLLKQFVDSIVKSDSDQVIYIDKEDDHYRAITNAETLSNYIDQQLDKSKSGYKFIIIDEVQEIEHFENSIRAYAAKEKYDIYLTGSNSDLLSGELSTRLTGRYIEIPVFGLDFKEFCAFHQLAEDADSLNQFLKFGGMPFLKHLELNDIQPFEYLRSVMHSIVYKDIVSRYSIRNAAFLDRLIYFIADNIGSRVTAKKISDYLKSQRVSMSVNSVMDYLHYLTASQLVIKVKRNDIKGKRTFEIGEKYYFQDIGIRNTLTGYRVSDIGKRIENCVCHHLISNGYEVYTGDWQNKEIDFIAEKQQEKVYIQVAYLLTEEKTIQREFGNLMAIKDNYRKMVVSMDPATGASVDGIEHLSLLDFLRNFR